MADYKTPGVYIVEKNAFPSSAVAVETAVPVFIGYTQKAERKGKDLTCVPTRISSMSEYFELFGGAFSPKFDIREFPAAPPPAADTKADKGKAAPTPEVAAPDSGNLNLFNLNGKSYNIDWATNNELYFYSCIRFFYLNGGSDCYIMSVGSYNDITSGNAKKIATPGINAKHFTGDPEHAVPNVFEILEKEYEPTLVLMPDVVALEDNGYSLYQEVLKHCDKTQSRFGIFDVGRSVDGTNKPNVEAFREKIGSNFLKYGAAYYPWLQSSVIDASEVDFTNFSDQAILVDPVKLKTAKEAQKTAQDTNNAKTPKDTSVVPIDKNAAFADSIIPVTEDHAMDVIIKGAGDIVFLKNQDEFNNVDNFSDITKKANTLEAENNRRKQNITNFHQSLMASSPTYKKLMAELRTKMNLLPPSSAMAGIYTLVDTSRGVWKAPANVSVSNTNAPEVNISSDEQQTLNVDPVSGKSINIIRAFPGIGTLVWGARTLDGNSQDWRYINVRRTLIMIEQSLKLATRTYVFEPNDSGTWVTIQSMMNNFLHNLWKQGALAGAVPEQAYSVQIGLGITMTPNDILDGLLKVTVLLAIVRPAEFIEITFQQQQQQS